MTKNEINLPPDAKMVEIVDVYANVIQAINVEWFVIKAGYLMVEPEDSKYDMVIRYNPDSSD